MKRTLALILCVVIVTSLCGCGREPTKREADGKAPHVMTVVDEAAGYAIYMHDETGVCYFCRYAAYGISVCVMLNADGTPYVWEEHDAE